VRGPLASSKRRSSLKKPVMKGALLEEGSPSKRDRGGNWPRVKRPPVERSMVPFREQGLCFNEGVQEQTENPEKNEAGGLREITPEGGRGLGSSSRVALQGR